MQNSYEVITVIVFGDGKNDIDMFQRVDENYAVQICALHSRCLTARYVALRQREFISYRVLAKGKHIDLRSKISSERSLHIDKSYASKPYASQLHCIAMQRYKFLAEFAIYPCGCDIPKGAICPFGTRLRNLYYIATEQSGVISHLNRVKIYRTNRVSISPK